MVQRTLPRMVQPSNGVFLRLRFRVGGAIGPFGLGIEDDHVGIAADGERAAAFEVRAARRVAR